MHALVQDTHGPTPSVNAREIVTSPKRLARIAGLFYLFVAIFGGFAEGFVDQKLYVAGDAAATAANVVANAGLARIGVVAHLVNGVFLVLVAMALYLLLNHVQKNAARWMVVLVALAAGITSLNAVFQFEAMQVATDSTYAAAFSVAGSNALVLLLLDIQHYGTLAAQVSFGLWLAPLGYLALPVRAVPEGARRGPRPRHHLVPRPSARRRSWSPTSPSSHPLLVIDRRSSRRSGCWATCS